MFSRSEDMFALLRDRIGQFDGFPASAAEPSNERVINRFDHISLKMIRSSY